MERAVGSDRGNIQTIGAKPDGSEWTVGIKNPFGAEPLGSLCIKDEAVITSGGYERFFTGEDGRRYIHIFDGRTALPVSNKVVSATAVGKSGVLCDALSTSLFVLGPEKAAAFWTTAGVIMKRNANYSPVFPT